VVGEQGPWPGIRLLLSGVGIPPAWRRRGGPVQQFLAAHRNGCDMRGALVHQTARMVSAALAASRYSCRGHAGGRALMMVNRLAAPSAVPPTWSRRATTCAPSGSSLDRRMSVRPWSARSTGAAGAQSMVC